MLFRQITHDDLGCASYLIGDDGAREVPGERCAIAGSLLSSFGVRDVVHVAEGGVGTWERQGHPIER
jgi:hypothetical protein